MTLLDRNVDNDDSADGKSVGATPVRSVISHLVIALSIAHAALGCGWHCEHVSTNEVGCIHAEAAPHDHGCRRHDTPVPCSDECGDECRFVSPERVRLDHSTVSFEFLTSRSTAVEAATKSLAAHRDLRVTASSPRPIRLHLWNRLLLI